MTPQTNPNNNTNPENEPLSSESGLQWLAGNPWALGRRVLRGNPFLHLAPAAAPSSAQLLDFEFKPREAEHGGFTSKIIISAPDVRAAANAGAEFCLRECAGQEVTVFARPLDADQWQTLTLRLSGQSANENNGKESGLGLRDALMDLQSKVSQELAQSHQDQLAAVAKLIDKNHEAAAQCEFLSREASALVNDVAEALKAVAKGAPPELLEIARGKAEKAAWTLERAQEADVRAQQVFQETELGLLRLHRHLSEQFESAESV